MDNELDIINFGNIDIADVKHVEGPSYSHRRSLLIVTIADANIPLVDIEKLMEMGMNVARLKTSHITKTDRVKLLSRFDKAAKFLAQKYAIKEWPCATSLELKTSVVQTGLLEEDASQILVKTGIEVILTNELSEFDKCNNKRIFVDNPYLTSDVEIGMELNISQAEIILECIEKYENSVKCRVKKGGFLKNMAYVCMRGAVRKRPYLTKKDFQLIKFAIEYQVDMIIINYPRNVASIKKIKKYISSKPVKTPFIITGISTQEGLMNIDDFIREADGILLRREFLAYEVEPALYDRMANIQLYMAGKCKQAGKPFYISGEIFQEALKTGNFSIREISDVTNAVQQGTSGFVLSEFSDINYLCDAMSMISDVCASVEPLCMKKNEFWKIVSQIKMPVNAAEASAVSCAVVANQTNARVIIVPTVSGRTAYLLNWLQPNSIVIGVSTKIKTIRVLKAFRGLIPLLYKGAPRRTWFETVQDRVNFALQYAVSHHWVQYGDHYITLEKGTEGSSYCDAVRVWNVTMTKKNVIECPESYHDFDIDTYADPETIKKRKKKELLAKMLAEAKLAKTKLKDIAEADVIAVEEPEGEEKKKEEKKKEEEKKEEKDSKKEEETKKEEVKKKVYKEEEESEVDKGSEEEEEHIIEEEEEHRIEEEEEEQRIEEERYEAKEENENIKDSKESDILDEAVVSEKENNENVI